MNFLRQFPGFFPVLGGCTLSFFVIGIVAASATDNLTAFAQKPAEQSADLTTSKPAEGAAAAKETFERLKKLEGKWTGRSSKGWTEAITFKTIAQGSVVHESSFDAHPNETMAT